MARQAIRSWVRGEPYPDPDVPGGEAPAGAFVTLYRGEELRGCLGRLEADQPLGQVVAEMAVAAARDDPRFPPVSADEVQDLTIEISVLTEPKPARPEGVEVGRDGVIVRKGARQGVLLPQVATEYDWDRETLLTMVCRKAGLPDHAWRDRRAELLVFQAEVITEAVG
ncbi:MAG: AmmeMemoRadiSam system protein A [Gemmatimonadales bacterium]